MNLYDFQKEAVSFHSKAPYSINGYEMGLGKTLISLASSEETKKCLVICPAFLVTNWCDEISKFGLPREKFLIRSYGSLKKVEDIFARFDTVIVDEAHMVKNLKAQRTRLLHKLIQKYKPKRLYLLTGTPVKNEVTDFYSLLRLCWYGGKFPEFEMFGNSFHRFAAVFTNKKATPYGVKYEGLKNTQRLKDLIAPVYIRKRADEVLDLPEEVTREILFDERSKTDSLLKTAWEAYEGNKKSRSFAAGKAISALAKCEYTVEFIKENIEQMGKVLIYTDHVQAAKKLHERLPGSGIITGKVPPQARKPIVDSINSGLSKILISTIGSLSVGVNITGVNHMVFNDLSWVPADISQARKRIHRIGQKKTCFYYYMLASNVDKAIVKTLEKKRKILEAMEDHE